jgi:GAF domain-containing protein
MKGKERDYFQAVYQVAVAINSSLEPREVMRTVSQSAAAALQAKACSIMLLTPDRTELRHGVDYGLSEQYVRKGPVSVDLSMSEALKGRAVSVLDAATDPKVQYGAEAKEEGIASMLSVPIRLRGDVIGVVRIYTAEPREFTADEVEFVEAVAHLGAIALENAQSHQQVKDNYDMLFRYIHNEMWV